LKKFEIEKDMGWLKYLTIPAEVFLNPNLSYRQMLIFSVIEVMNPCEATNAYLGLLLNMDKSTVRKDIYELIRQNYILPTVCMGGEKRVLKVNPRYKINNQKYLIIHNILYGIDDTNTYDDLIKYWNNLPGVLKKVANKDFEIYSKVVRALNSLYRGEFSKYYTLDKEFLYFNKINKKDYSKTWSIKKIKLGLEKLSQIYSADELPEDKSRIPTLDILFYNPIKRTSLFLSYFYTEEKKNNAVPLYIKRMVGKIINYPSKNLKKRPLGFRGRLEENYHEKIDIYKKMFEDLIRRKLTDRDKLVIQDVIVEFILTFELLDVERVGGNHFSYDLGELTNLEVLGDPTKFIQNYCSWLRNVKFANGFPIQPSVLGVKSTNWGEFCDYIQDVLGYDLSDIDGRYHMNY